MTEKGYTVQKGAFEFFTQDRCQELQNCFANNPSSPYGITFLPAGPFENVATYPLWEKILRTEVDGVSMSGTYRLDPRETVITIGQTPPRCLYYSYLPYVFDRYYPFGWSSTGSGPTKCPTVTDARGGRCTLFASLGNPINMLTINSSRENGQSFNSEFAYFMSGDMDQVKYMQKMSEEAGIAPSIHNTFGLSTQRVNLGLTPISDGFSHLLRFVFGENQDEFNEYIKNPSEYVTILRVTPPAGQSEGSPFTPPVFKERVSTPESVLSKGLTNQALKMGLNGELKRGILEKYVLQYPFVNSFTLNAPSFDNGYDCMDRGTKCNGDIQDTLYPNSLKAVTEGKICSKLLGELCPVINRMTLEEDGSDFFIATGVNHNATKSGLYSSIAMYNLARLESIGVFNSMPIEVNSDSYVGSAKQYLRNRSVSEYLFAVKITRKCEEGESFCLEISKTGPNSLPINGSCLFIERIYMDELKAGPSRDATIKPIIYHFSKKRFSTSRVEY